MSLIFSERNNIAVLDLTHAGIIIAQKLAELGQNVTAVDVYGTVDDETLESLDIDHGITTSKIPLPIDDFDHIVSPVHLDPEYGMLASARIAGREFISHHRIVGMILLHIGKFEGVKVIEITGSKAKTSSASLLADMLSRNMSVVLHTSRGLELWENGVAEKIYSGLSIAPGSILHAVDRLESENIHAECYIFEVSIGGTGIGDVGIITTLEPDYSIAKSSSLASDAKLQMVELGKEDSLMVLNSRDSKAIRTARELGRDVFTFSDSEEFDADLHLAFDGRTVSLVSDEIDIKADVNPLYNASSYVTAFAASGAVALNMGVNASTVADVICDFVGLAGRMQEKELHGRILVDNSNSGMDIRSVERALDYGLSRNTGRVLMVLGEEAEQVCEGLPPEDVAAFIGRRFSDIDELILVGERMKSIMPENARYAPGLDNGIEDALSVSRENDLILSCVKCFR